MGYYKKVLQNIFGTSGALKKVRRSFQFTRPWTESFTGNTGNPPDSRYWTKGGNASLYSNKLRLTADATDSLSFVRYKNQLSGNFEAKADLTMVTAPSTQNWQANLRAFVDESNMVFATKSYNGGNLYWSGESMVGGAFLANTVLDGSYTGGLRVVRIGTTVSCHYWNGSSWILIHTRSSFTTAPIWIELIAFRQTNVFTLRADYDNFYTS